MTGSIWPQVVDAVLDVLDSAPLGGARLFDGPPPVDDASPLGVAIGMPGPVDGQDISGQTEQTWRDAGPAPFANREETGSIGCTAWAWTGNDFAFRTLRANVRGLLDAITDALAAITPLNLPTVIGLQLHSRIEWVQRQDERGTTVEAMFRITYAAVFS